MDKRGLSERDICTKYITPAIVARGWDVQTQVRENVHLTKGRVIVRGKLVSRGKAKFADYVLYHKPNVPLAIIEAKDNNHSVGDGMQQGLGYAEMLDVPFVFSSNGDGFLFHDRTGQAPKVEEQLSLDQFPSPEELWRRYCTWRALTPATEAVVAQDYHSDASGKTPRYYQMNAVNRVIEAVARGQDRILLVMATGTGKTLTAFQIIWRLWKAGVKKRILFLADRNILVDQTKTNDFKPFGGAMTKITNRKVDKSFEIYLALYQAISSPDEESDLFRQFSPDFFDLIIVDECHRGSAADNSAWRQVLDYFSGATQLGLTATPKETADVSTTNYFGEAVYTYSLKQGIEDGFLAPYKVVRIDLDKDLAGWRPEKGRLDKHGQEIEDRVYNQRDFDRFERRIHEPGDLLQHAPELANSSVPNASPVSPCSRGSSRPRSPPCSQADGSSRGTPSTSPVACSWPTPAHGRRWEASGAGSGAPGPLAAACGARRIPAASLAIASSSKGTTANTTPSCCYAAVGSGAASLSIG